MVDRCRFLNTTFLLVMLVSFGQCRGDDSSVEKLFEDEFKSGELNLRRALRGEWKIGDGHATCTQDDVLYRKYKDHGPIIFYDLPHDNAVVTFRVRGDGLKTCVFTANGKDGHVFRLVLSDRGVNVRAFPPNSDSKSIAVYQNSAPLLKDGEWTKVNVVLKGESATVQIGDALPIRVQHDSFKTARTNLSLGFSFGTLTVADFCVRYTLSP